MDSFLSKDQVSAKAGQLQLHNIAQHVARQTSHPLLFVIATVNRCESGVGDGDLIW